MSTIAADISNESFLICPQKFDGRADATVLLIGGSPSVLLNHLRNSFSIDELHIETAVSSRLALECIADNPPSLILLDGNLLDSNELELQLQIRQLEPGIPIIFLVNATGTETVIKAMGQGAHNCLFKPIERGLLKQLVMEALALRNKPHSTRVTLNQDNYSCSLSLLGKSPPMLEVYKSIGRVATQDVNVLITGESGTGKELVARAIHRHSSRSKAPFLALNCAAIPENLLESELFGHEKGAFSGADRRRIGKFEQCDGGTILLDEIGDMPLSLQAKILRLLQEQTFERVGGNETVKTDVRIIASTHRDLKMCAVQDRFRPDLYYRLSVFTIELPPLRDRDNDLVALVEHYIQRFSRELGRNIQQIAPDAMEQLRRYHWPGNIRELQSVLKQALLRASGVVLLSSFLPELTAGPVSSSSQAGEQVVNSFIHQRLTPDARDQYAKVHTEFDRHFLPFVLKYSNGNQRQAAEVLGIARQTLRGKLRELGLSVSQSIEVNDVD